MEHTTENIITYANIIALTKSIINKIGYDFQAPLEEASIEEIISSQTIKSLEPVLNKGNRNA